MNKREKRKKKLRENKQHKIENSKKYSLQVIKDGEWVRPRDVEKNTDTPEYFRTLNEIDNYVIFMEDIKKANSGVMEARVLETKTGVEVVHIEPFVPVESDD